MEHKIISVTALPVFLLVRIIKKPRNNWINTIERLAQSLAY